MSAAAPGVRPRPRLMGILNVTPDSFSDGGRYIDRERAIEHGCRLVLDGAEIIDVGGESTRPGAEPVSAAEELRRVIGVIAGLREAQIAAAISIDTSKAAVAAAALDEGATIVNDVTALRGDPELAALLAERGVECVLMHMLGEPRTMQRDPAYADVVGEVAAFLAQRVQHACAAGIEASAIMLDPGFGFGKTPRHNVELLARLDELVALGRPIVVGTSRKSFIGALTGRAVGDRLAGTIATNVLAYERGASVFRVHDVAAVRDALAVAATVSAA